MYLLILCITSYLTKMGDDDVVDNDENKKCVYISTLQRGLFLYNYNNSKQLENVMLRTKIL